MGTNICFQTQVNVTVLSLVLAVFSLSALFIYHTILSTVDFPSCRIYCQKCIYPDIKHIFSSPLLLLCPSFTSPGAGCEVYAFCGALFGICSMITLMVIAVDRYMVITRPLASLGEMSRRKALSIVGAAWFYSMGWSLPPFFGWSEYNCTQIPRNRVIIDQCDSSEGFVELCLITSISLFLFCVCMSNS